MYQKDFREQKVQPTAKAQSLTLQELKSGNIPILLTKTESRQTM